MAKAYSLKTLRLLATAACAAAEMLYTGGVLQEAVNWGDLSCIEARRIKNDAGETYYEVVLAEAGDSCPTLTKFVADYLAHQNFPGVTVVTEW